MRSERPDGLPREVRVLAVVAFVVALGFGIVAPAIPLFARDFGVGRTAVGLAVSAFAFFRFVSAFGGGSLVGHAYVAGRDAAQAELAAVLDAALQDEALRPALMETVVEPLAAAQADRAARIARKAAATRVDFSTLAVMR